MKQLFGKNYGTEERKVRFYSFCASLCLFITFIDYVISGSLKLIGLGSDHLRIIVYIIYLILTISCILINCKKFRVSSLFLPLLLATALIISLCHESFDREEYKDTWLFLLLISIPTYLVFRNFPNFRRNHIILYKYILFFSYLSGVFFSIIFLIHYFVSPILNSVNYQTTSYAFLLPTIFILGKKHKKSYDFVLLTFLLLLSIFAGGRASLFCLFVYLVVVVLRRGKNNPVWFFVLLTIGLFGFFFFDSVLSFIVTVCKSLGIKGGIVTYSNMGNVFTDNRSKLYEYCFSLINDGGFWGYGMLGDRYYIRLIDYYYAHNLFLELLLQFGWLITTMFSVWFLLKVFSFHLTFKNDSYCRTIFDSLFYSTGFMVLMFSSTYFTRPDFFALLGLIGMCPYHFLQKRISDGATNKQGIERKSIQRYTF